MGWEGSRVPAGQAQGGFGWVAAGLRCSDRRYCASVTGSRSRVRVEVGARSRHPGQNPLDPLPIMALYSSYPLYALDVRGLGASMPQGSAEKDFFQAYGMDYMLHGYGILFGESYLGRRVYDVLCVMDLLVQEGAEEIILYGPGTGRAVRIVCGAAPRPGVLGHAEKRAAVLSGLDPRAAGGMAICQLPARCAQGV